MTPKPGRGRFPGRRRHLALDNLVRESRPIAGDGLTSREASSGTVLGVQPTADGKDGFWARLVSGAGPEYQMREQIGTTTADRWEDKPAGRSGPCKEANSLAGLKGKVVWMLKEGGTYRFVFRRKRTPLVGCDTLPAIEVCVFFGCCPTDGSTVTVTGPDGDSLGECTTVLDPHRPPVSCCTIHFSHQVPIDSTITITVRGPDGIVVTRTMKVVCGTISLFFDLTRGHEIAYPPLHLSFTGPEALTGSTGAVDLVLDYDPAASDPTTGLYVWTTGCIGGRGWGHCYDPLADVYCYLHGSVGGPYDDPCLFPVYVKPVIITETINYASTKVTITFQTSDRDGRNVCSVYVDWSNYWNAGCPDFDPPPSCGHFGNGANAPAHPSWYCHTVTDCPCGLDGNPDGKPMATSFYNSKGATTVHRGSDACVCWRCPPAIDLHGTWPEGYCFGAIPPPISVITL